MSHRKWNVKIILPPVCAYTEEEANAIVVDMLARGRYAIDVAKAPCDGQKDDAAVATAAVATATAAADMAPDHPTPKERIARITGGQPTVFFPDCTGLLEQEEEAKAEEQYRATEAVFASAFPGAKVSMINDDTVTVMAESTRIPDAIPGWRIHGVNGWKSKACIIYKAVDN